MLKKKKKTIDLIKCYDINTKSTNSIWKKTIEIKLQMINIYGEVLAKFSLNYWKLEINFFFYKLQKNAIFFWKFYQVDSNLLNCFLKKKH